MTWEIEYIDEFSEWWQTINKKQQNDLAARDLIITEIICYFPLTDLSCETGILIPGLLQ